jgi:hypothetical protein
LSYQQKLIVQEEDLEMEITHKNQTYKIVQIKTAPDNFREQLGWTHFAEVKRPNGKKSYWANIFIVDGVIVQSKVIN